MQLVVVSAVMAAVSIATSTSTALRLISAQAFSFLHSCQELEIDFSRRAAEYAEVTLSINFSRVLWEYTE